MVKKYIDAGIALTKFLKAAASLAKQGVKQDDILRAAQKQFGEVSDLLKLQINKIFKNKDKPVVGIKTKDPVFDSTVEKLPYDDTGAPFNPKNPQKTYGKPKEVDTGSPFEDYRRNVLGEGKKKTSDLDDILDGVEGEVNIYSKQYITNLDNQIIDSGLYTKKEWVNLDEGLKEARRKNFDTNYRDAMEGMIEDKTLENSIILNNFDPKGRKPNAMGGRIGYKDGTDENLVGIETLKLGEYDLEGFQNKGKGNTLMFGSDDLKMLSQALDYGELSDLSDRQKEKIKESILRARAGIINPTELMNEIGMLRLEPDAAAFLKKITPDETMEKVFFDKEGDARIGVQKARKLMEDVAFGSQKNPSLSSDMYNKLSDEYIQDQKKAIQRKINFNKEYGDANFLNFKDGGRVGYAEGTENMMAKEDYSSSAYRMKLIGQLMDTGGLDYGSAVKEADRIIEIKLRPKKKLAAGGLPNILGY